MMWLTWQIISSFALDGKELTSSMMQLTWRVKLSDTISECTQERGFFIEVS